MFQKKKKNNYLINEGNYHGQSHGWTWGGQWPPQICFLKNIIIYMDTNFSNFVLENYTFVPLKISLILLKVLL